VNRYRITTSTILFPSIMNSTRTSTMKCWSSSPTCPTQACHNYNATICYEQINKTEHGSTTNFFCPSINLCIVPGCVDLQTLMTPNYLNLTSPNKYDINCQDEGTTYAIEQISSVGSRGAIRGDTLVALMAIGISLLVCGSVSI
jgi:hypothetical protein